MFGHIWFLSPLPAQPYKKHIITKLLLIFQPKEFVCNKEGNFKIQRKFLNAPELSQFRIINENVKEFSDIVSALLKIIHLIPIFLMNSYYV